MRDRQAIKRAKDKDGERGALNTLHNAQRFSLVLKQKGKEKDGETQRDRERVKNKRG